MGTQERSVISVRLLCCLGFSGLIIFVEKMENGTNFHVYCLNQITDETIGFRNLVFFSVVSCPFSIVVGDSIVTK